MHNYKKKIFITGGAGYCGSRLVPQLLDEGYFVTVFDKLYFGSNFFPKNHNLEIIKGDIRDTDLLKKNISGHDIFIHLACISNDASFELDENLSTTINYDCFEPMVLAAKEKGIKRFIYASSSSVYGISDQKDVTEEHPLVPLTLYNKYKGLCEPILFKHSDSKFITTIFRPATVCGYAPRLRLDLSVNILTNHAYNNGIIKVFGGEQLRPNLHIQDYCETVKLLINAKSEKIQKNIFNVGYQNMSISDLSILVKKVVEKKFPKLKNIQIIKTPSDDNRSYHINSDKIFKILNFKPQHSIEDAISEICDFFKNNNSYDKSDYFENDIFYNVKRIKNLENK